MPRVCVFGVYETLLDLAAIRPLFRQHFGEDAVEQEWFAQLVQLGFVTTITDKYADVPTLASAALKMVAARHAVALSADAKMRIVAAMRELPAHPEVRAALNLLLSKGIRVAALTNSPREMAEAQLAFAGIRDCFELVLSADAVRRLKPAPQPYRMAAERLGITPRQTRLIAAHSWDITGALRAGCAAAFVARGGDAPDPLAPAPDVVGNDLHAVAERIIAAEMTVA